MQLEVFYIKTVTLDEEPMNFSVQTTSQLDCKLVKWTLTQEQTKAIEKAYEGYKDSRQCSFEEFCERVRNFSIIPVENKNGIVGAIMIRKNEFHISVTEPFNMRKYIRTVFNPLFKNYLEVVTTVIKSNTKRIRIC
jgi:hypothetical protein